MGYLRIRRVRQHCIGRRVFSGMHSWLLRPRFRRQADQNHKQIGPPIQRDFQTRTFPPANRFRYIFDKPEPQFQSCAGPAT
jgi:hypothetical protein